MEGAASPRPHIEYVPAAPELIDSAEDYSHLHYARGYVYHGERHSPEVPGFWRSITFAGRTFRWDPRGTLAVAEAGGCAVLLYGHALHSELGTTDLGRIADHLLTGVRRNRADYADRLEDMFGQYVVIARARSGAVRLQTDAIGSRAAFHDRRARIVASHVQLVGETIGAKTSRYRGWVKDVRNNDFPGRTTRYRHVLQLLPNSEVTIGSGRITRVGPRPFEPLSVDEAAEQMLPILRSQSELLLDSGREIVISASAGVDSRTSLATFADAGEAVKVFTYTKEPGSGRQWPELHRDKLAATMSADLGLPHQMFDLTTAEHPPKAYVAALNRLSTRRSNTVISWVYHQELPHDALHIRGQINGVGKWHFARQLHFSESLELSARRMATLTKRAKGVDREIEDPFWDMGERGFQEYIDATGLRSVPAGYRMTDLFLWEHRVGNWNHPHIVESDVTFDTYQIFGSRRMIRLMLSVPELDRVQLSLFRELIRRQEPSLLDYPLNGKPWEPPVYDLPLSAYQQGVTRHQAQLAELRKTLASAQSAS